MYVKLCINKQWAPEAKTLDKLFKKERLKYNEKGIGLTNFYIQKKKNWLV